MNNVHYIPDSFLFEAHGDYFVQFPALDLWKFSASVFLELKC